MPGCSRYELLDATIPSCGYVRTADVSYGPLPRQKLDVYRPTGASAATPAPVVVFFYGGGWQEGEKANYRFVAQALTSRGFVAVLPDYRLYPEATFPAFVEDAAQAVRWAVDHAADIGGAGGRGVYLMGHSAGAHIVALLTLDEHYLLDVGLDRTAAVRATAALSGPYEFDPGPGYREVFGGAATGPPAGAADRAANWAAATNPAGSGEPTPADPRSQPIHFADGRAPPMLLVHGLADDVVDPANADRLAERIRRKGGAVRTALYPGKDHVAVVLGFAWPFRRLAPTLDDVTAFFREVEQGRPKGVAGAATPPSARHLN